MKRRQLLKRILDKRYDHSSAPVLSIEISRKFCTVSRTKKTSSAEFMAHRLSAIQTVYKKNAYRLSPQNRFYNVHSIEEIRDIFESHNDELSIDDLHGAIAKCAALDHVEMCWILFEFAKSKYRLSADIFYRMIVVLNHSKVYQNETKVMQIFHQLCSEMEQFDIAPTHKFITACFALLTKYHQWDEAHSIWRKLQLSQRELLFDVAAWNAYFNLCIKQATQTKSETDGDNISKLTNILKLVDEMHTEYQVKPNFVTYGTLTYAVARFLKRQIRFDQSMCSEQEDGKKTKNRNKQAEIVKIGECLFEQYQQHLTDGPHTNVYNGMIDMYGNYGNTDKCMEYLRVTIKKELSKQRNSEKGRGRVRCVGSRILDRNQTGMYYIQEYLFDERSVRTSVGATIKSVINNQDISYEEGWTLVQYLVEEVLKKQCGLKPDIVLYAQLFHCCASFGREHVDVKKMKSLYVEMVNEGIKPNGLALNNFLVGAALKYEGNKKKMDKLAKWVLREFDKYRVPMARVTQVRLSEMMIYHDDKIKRMLRDSHVI